MKKLISKIVFVGLVSAAVFTAVSCTAKKVVTVESVADLEGKKIGVQSGTTGDLYVSENIPSAKVSQFRTGIDAAIDLKSGGIDLIVLDELPAREIVKNNSSLKIVDLDLEKEEYAIAVRKGNTALLDSINRTISNMKANGEYEMLTAAFMPADGNIVIPAEIETSGEPLRMGTNAAFPPFEYIEGVKFVGFDITLSQMIARDCGKKLDVNDMAFDGLIAALQSGAVDFVAAGMTATDERRQNVDFSEPYYSSKQVVIVRK